jgi:hypothetical protein
MRDRPYDYSRMWAADPVIAAREAIATDIGRRVVTLDISAPLETCGFATFPYKRGEISCRDLVFKLNIFLSFKRIYVAIKLFF